MLHPQVFLEGFLANVRKPILQLLLEDFLLQFGRRRILDIYQIEAAERAQVQPWLSNLRRNMQIGDRNSRWLRLSPVHVSRHEAPVVGVGQVLEALVVGAHLEATDTRGRDAHR